MKKVDVASALLFDPTGQNLLLVKNVKGNSTYWSPPGGAVEAGETLEQAAIREVKEETGFDITVKSLHSVREAFYMDRGNHAIIFTFHAEIVGGEMNIQDPDQDIVDVRWVDLPTARQLMPQLAERLRLTEDPITGTAYYSFEG